MFNLVPLDVQSRTPWCSISYPLGIRVPPVGNPCTRWSVFEIGYTSNDFFCTSAIKDKILGNGFHKCSERSIGGTNPIPHGYSNGRKYSLNVLLILIGQLVCVPSFNFKLLISRDVRIRRKVYAVDLRRRLFVYANAYGHIFLVSYRLRLRRKVFAVF